MKKMIQKNSMFLTTMLLVLLLSFTSCLKTEHQIIPRPNPGTNLPIDPTNYRADRGGVAQFYGNDPVQYYAQFGIPALSRLARLIEATGGNPYNAFGSLQPFFIEQAFMNAIELNMIHPDFSNAYFNNASLPGFQALVQAFMAYTDQLTMYVDEGATQHPNIALIHQVFAQVLIAAFDPIMFETLAPIPEKEYVTPFPPNQIDPLGYCGMDSFTEPLCMNPPASPDDNNTSSPRKWSDITGIHWSTTYNGACGTLAAGACAQKLGILTSTTNGKEWNDLSKEIGATPGKMGAPMSGINDYFKGKGYGVSTAWDGLRESAVEEAKAALARGCDVMLHYISADGKSAHLEVVTKVDVDGADDEKGTITTLSWGQSATTTYDSGEFSGKSDGSRYRQSTEPKSYLESKGTARLVYYCKD